MKGDEGRQRYFQGGQASSSLPCYSRLWRLRRGGRDVLDHSAMRPLKYTSIQVLFLVVQFILMMALLVAICGYGYQKSVVQADLNMPPLTKMVNNLISLRQFDENKLHHENENSKEGAQHFAAAKTTRSGEEVDQKPKQQEQKDEGKDQQLQQGAVKGPMMESSVPVADAEKTLDKLRPDQNPLPISSAEPRVIMLPDEHVVGLGQRVNLQGQSSGSPAPSILPAASLEYEHSNSSEIYAIVPKNGKLLPPPFGRISKILESSLPGALSSQPLSPASPIELVPSSFDHEHTSPSELQPAEEGNLGWVQFPYPSANETEILMLQVRSNGTRPCHNIRTKTAEVHGLPKYTQLEYTNRSRSSIPVIRLAAGPILEFTVVSIGDDGQPRCAGGDYFETDLSGPKWKSRPPILDLGNGNYSVKLQMDPRFASGLYTFRVILLFSNFHGLHHRPSAWARMEEVANYEIEFVVHNDSERLLIARSAPGAKIETLSAANNESPVTSSVITTTAPQLQLPMCKLEDFRKKYWSGRWTRELATDDCEYTRYGRWLCVDENLPCQKPWCEGKVGALESNGWVYSAHCAFKNFNEKEAWQCLDGKWMFFWGDSNHMDTIRNLLNFVLGFQHEIRFLDRRMDKTFFHPRTNLSSVRITSMFNGHSNVTKNYEGLFSLHDPQYAEQLRSFFTGETAPDVMIMNSGLHDGVFWKDVESFFEVGMELAIKFWTDVWSKMRARRPDLLYRSTISTGGNARNMSFNPQKLELFNHLMVDRFETMELERFHIIDGFDYTYPWHFDHKTNDGVHYGRPPSKSKWAGGNIGHRYFVDLMLVHMLLNAICPHS